MKKTIGILMFAMFGLSLTSCIDKNDPLVEIDGTWNLLNVSGGLAGVNIDYTEGEVSWDFDVSTEKVVVSNLIDTTGPEQIHSGPATGTYDFITTATDELKIDNVDRGEISINGDTLTLDDGLAVDGFITTLVR